MRHYIVASHHQLACGLKDTLVFLTSINTNLHEISAYVDSSVSIDTQIENVFSNISEEDEVIIMSDMKGGSVNQKFYPFINDHVHLISGINLPLAVSLLLLPKHDKITKEKIEELVEEAKQQIIYINEFENTSSDDDE